MNFFQEAIHLMPQIFTVRQSDLVPVILSLTDMTLVGSLLIMAMFSGYENFVSTIDLDDETEKLDWLGKYAAGTPKVAASIVAI